MKQSLHSETTPLQHAQCKAGVLQGGVLSPILLNLCASDIPQTSSTCTSHFIRRRHHHNINTHKHQSNAYIKPYLKKVHCSTHEQKT